MIRLIESAAREFRDAWEYSPGEAVFVLIMALAGIVGLCAALIGLCMLFYAHPIVIPCIFGPILLITGIVLLLLRLSRDD